MLTEGITPTESRDTKTAAYLRVTEKPIITGKEKPTAKFEKRALSYLFENKDDLGIASVFSLQNLLVDAAIKLKNSKLILVEFKYALNWHNACTARVEIQGFLAERLYTKFPELENPERALIVFDHFSSDWDRQPESNEHKNGWNFFYEEENVLRKMSPIPIDIAQLKDKRLINKAKKKCLSFER